MISDDSFSEQLEAMRQRMLDLSLRADSSLARDGLVPEVLEHLGTTIEELSVTGEELRQQTEELARTRQAIEAERQRYQDLFQNAPEGYLVTDAEGIIQEANLTAAGMLGAPPERLAGKPLLLFIGSTARSAFLDRLNRVDWGRQTSIEWECQLLPRTGAAFPAILGVQPLRSANGVHTLRWTLRQVKVPSRGRDPREYDQTLSTLQCATGRMAHHLANDLATIQGQLELLQTPDLPPKFREGLEALRAASLSANEMLRRVQAFSRLRPAALLEPTDLTACLREALAITRPQQQYRAVTIRSQVGDLPSVLGHAAEIRDALVQVMLNAVEAMPGGGTLTISARTSQSERATNERSTRWVSLNLADSGAGMSDEVRQHLFEPFFTTKGVERAGLGLAMVYGIMRRHLGAVDVSSVPKWGCSVTLWFRTAGTDAAVAAPPSAARRLEGVRTLLIDDNDMVRRTIAELLRRRGLMVVEAVGGAEGLARAAEAPVDVVVTDLQMPGMNGWELARALKARLPGLPIIVLTGWGESPAGSEEGACPADRVVAKPIERDRLLAIIAELVLSRRMPPPP